MKSFISGVVLTASLFLAFAVFAKDGTLATVRPVVVDIQQTVPVLADVVVPLANGERVTTTVPLTVAVNLQVTVSGPISKTVVAKAKPKVSVAVPTPKAPSEQVPVTQDVELLYDQMRWTVTAWRDWGHEYKPDPNGGGYSFTSANRLIAVYFAVENMSDAPRDTRYGPGEPYDISLKDDKDRTYASIDHPYYDRCRPLEVNPGLSKPCIIVYEVPSAATGFGVIFKAEDGNNEQAVGLGR